MIWFPNKKTTNHQVIIERVHQDELEKAIAELEKRGYELIKSGVKNDVNVAYQQHRSDQLTANLNANRKRSLNPVDTVKLFAIMKRKQVNT